MPVAKGPMAIPVEMIDDRVHALRTIQRHGIGTWIRCDRYQVRRRSRVELTDLTGQLLFVEMPDKDNRFDPHGKKMTKDFVLLSGSTTSISEVKFFSAAAAEARRAYARRAE